jgi:hypothetical protein
MNAPVMKTSCGSRNRVMNADSGERALVTGSREISPVHVIGRIDYFIYFSGLPEQADSGITERVSGARTHTFKCPPAIHIKTIN